MTRKKFLPLSRRSFIKLIGLISIMFMLSNPFQLYAGSIPSPLISFAQVTDVHIVDNGNELRFEEVLLTGKYGLGALLVKNNLIPLPISHDTDDTTAYNWDRVIRSINTEHEKQQLDFVINTGDSADTNLENELKWSIEIANGGPLSEDYYNRNGKKDVYNLTNIAGFKMPWYAVLGNHDVEYQGSINYKVKNLDKLLDFFSKNYPYSYNNLCTQQEALKMYLKAGGNPKGHGFANMPKPIFPFTIKEGYYSFNTTNNIHIVVLNTANYRPEIMFGQLGYREFFPEGFMNGRQFIWMKQDIKNNSDKLCIVFSHHPKPYMFSATKDQFAKTMSSYPNVIAHIAGHTHENKIDPVTYSNGYWRITTDAAYNPPHIWRNFTITDNGNGTGTIKTNLNNADGIVTENNSLLFNIKLGKK